MNLKIGQIIKHKRYEETRKVLEVLQNLVALSEPEDHESFWHWRSFKEIEENYILPEEEWKPGYDEMYWYINADGNVDYLYHINKDYCNGCKNFLGIYRTKEDAEKALKDIKNKLGK